MSLGAHDERELLVPLLDGIHQRPLWDIFLRRLLVRTRSTQVCLMVRTAQMAGREPLMRVASAQPGQPAPDWDALEAMGLSSYAALRPSRVYALEEMLDPDTPEKAKRQRRELAAVGMGHARFIHVAARGEHHGWLVLIHTHLDFSGGDSALLTALAPPFASTLATLATLEALQLRAEMAEQALGLLGISQVALDREGRAVAGEDLARRTPELAGACASLDGARGPERRFFRLGEDRPDLMLLRPATIASTALPSTAVAIGAVRDAMQGDRSDAATAIAKEFGLSAREAGLADALSRGLSLMEAGQTLGLTPETTRNYSKRIYAKTGASGQADLVRMVLTSLAPLA
jgi:DNA-binding CsgD family transcriptional regulator